MKRKNNSKLSRIISAISLILVLLYIFLPSAQDDPSVPDVPLPDDTSITGTVTDPVKDEKPDEDGYYYSLEDVTEYLKTYGHLPENYITKSEANDLGWDSSKGNLWEVADGMVIGGDKFGNREGLLPKNTKYYECDVNYYGGYRGDDRIVYSEDGNIYFTSDHYNTFEHLGTFEVKK